MRRSGTILFGLGLGLGPIAAPAHAGSAHVRVVDDSFDAPEVSVPVGATVTWTNDGRNPHTITHDGGAFDSGLLRDDGRFSVTFEGAGSFAYHCIYHGAPGGRGMAGTILVGGAPAPPEDPPVPPPSTPGRTLRVPERYPSISVAVTSARPGDLVLVSPGVYTETVRVSTPHITIRGTDRNRVVLDGELRIPNGIQVLEADGVAIENLTVRRYTLNGISWARVRGFRGSYLSAVANGGYGIYAIDSRFGLIERSYAAGHPDSGFYVGQCHPCDTVISGVLAERNGVGYSGTNAGGGLYLVGSEWRDNQAGIVPNSLDAELYPPQRETTIAGNWVHDNSNRRAPARRFEYPTFGSGIFVTGGRRNTIVDNRVEDHETFGVALVMSIDRNYWLTGENEVRGNVVRGSGVADLALGAGATGGDCFEGNRYATSLPPAIELMHGCRFAPTGGAGGDLAVLAAVAGRYAAGDRFPHGDWRRHPPPPQQPSMPGAATAPPDPAEAVAPEPPPAVLPPPGPDPETGPRLALLGVAPLAAPSVWGVLISAYAYLLPLALYAAWLAIAVWDLARRGDLSMRRRLAWLAAVLLVPLAGPVLYLSLARSPIPWALRAGVVAGGMGAYVAFALLAYRLAGS